MGGERKAVPAGACAPAAARDEVIAEFGGDAGKLAWEILRLRTEMRQAANALTQARAQGYYFS